MKPLSSLLPALLLLLPLQGGALLHSLPEDTALVFTIRDVPGLNARRMETPLRRLPGMDAFETSLDPLNRIQDIFQGLHPLMNGEMVITMANPAPFFALVLEHQARRSTLWDSFTLEEDGDPELDPILAAREEMRAAELKALQEILGLKAVVRDPDAVEALLTEARTLLPALSWELRGEILVASFSEESVRNHFARLDAPAEALLTRSDDFRQALEALGEHDTLLYVNLPALFRSLAPFLNDRQSTAPGFDLSRLNAWLRPETLLPAVFTSRLTPEALRIRSHYGFREPGGLSRLLLGSNRESAPAPAFVHRQAGQVMALRWNPSETLQTLQRELAAVSPKLAVGFGFFKMSMNMQLGLDLEAALLNTLGTGLTLVMETDYAVADRLAELGDMSDPNELLQLSREHPTGGVHTLFALELQDTEAFQTGLSTLISSLTGQRVPEPVTVGGVEKIYLFQHLTTLPAELRLQIAATVMDGHWLLAVGNPGMLNRAAEALEIEALQLWRQPDVARTRAALPENPQVITYTSPDELKHTLGQTRSALRLLSTVSGGSIRFVGELPERPVFLNTLGAGIRVDERLINETLMPFAPEE